MTLAGRSAVRAASRVRSAGSQTGTDRQDRFRGDHRLRLRIAEDVRDLALAIQNIDGDEDHAQLHAGEIEVDHLQAVGQIDAQPVAGFQAALASSGAMRLLRASMSPKV